MVFDGEPDQGVSDGLTGCYKVSINQPDDDCDVTIMMTAMSLVVLIMLCLLCHKNPDLADAEMISSMVTTIY